MNKLVSKNPILRFKLGNRIVKAQKGTELYDENGNQLIIPPARKKSNNFIPITTPTHDWGLSSYGLSNKINTARVHNYGRGEVEYKKDTNGKWMAKYTSPLAKDLNWYYVSEGSTGYDSSGNYNKYVNGLWVKIKNSSPKTNSVSASKQTVRKPIVSTNRTATITVNKPDITTNKSIIAPTNFYGLGIGGTVLARGSNFNGLISDDARNRLIATGKFDNNSFSSVLNFLTALNNYFANDGAGSITVDDKWGNQTQKAFDLALAKAGESHGLTFNPNVNLYNNTIETPLSTVSYGYTPTEKIQVTTPQRIYNRADVRDFIRSREKNAYGFSGAQRRALRMVLNGQGTDTDRAIVSGMGIFKKGGLISKNPIKRFKNGGIQKFLKAGNLPTAPKAEDRYRGGLRVSVETKGGRYGGNDRMEIKEVLGKKPGMFGSVPFIRLTVVHSSVSPDYNDTTYIEVPERKNFLVLRKLRGVEKHPSIFRTYYSKVYPFYGSILPDLGSGSKLEYETLKQRFNTAWNIAK